MAICSQCGQNNTIDANFCGGCGVPMTATTDPSVQHKPASPPQTANLAGFWVRGFALLFDVLGIMSISYSLATACAIIFGDVNVRGLYGFLAYALCPWLWFTLAESSRHQATIGKRIFGLKVTNENGDRIGFGRANVRFLMKCFFSSMLLIDFAVAIFTKKKQTLHDLIARTLVVKKVP